jgi:dimeric dUTPase (all-alpha-NTP-PPase superfamily)
MGMINFKELYEIQGGLMDHIERNHPIKEGENREPKRFLAATVELAEAAQDWRGFKFWSTNQKAKDSLLEECTDFLHFLLEFGILFDYKIDKLKEMDGFKSDDISEMFLELFDALSIFRAEQCFDTYNDLMSTYFYVCGMLGFSEEQIEKAYKDKNQINHRRQQSGY